MSLHLEEGVYGPFREWDRGPMTCEFHYLVVISQDEFPRLQTGRFERPDVLTPYVSWMHAEVGHWGEKCWLAHPYGMDHVYFQDLTHATHFLIRWSS